MIVTIADESLRNICENIIKYVRQATGDSSTEVKVEVEKFGGNTGWSNSQWTYTVPSNFYIQSNSSSINTNGASFTTTTGSTILTPSITYSQGYSQSAPLTPDQVPASEVFEQMLLSTVKQLNEAYNLGRVHGYIEGKKHGGDEVKKEFDEAMDTDPLTYAENPSLDVSKTFPAV